jgi:hypothetical protein
MISFLHTYLDVYRLKACAQNTTNNIQIRIFLCCWIVSKLHTCIFARIIEVQDGNSVFKNRKWFLITRAQYTDLSSCISLQIHLSGVFGGKNFYIFVWACNNWKSSKMCDLLPAIMTDVQGTLSQGLALSIKDLHCAVTLYCYSLSCI